MLREQEFVLESRDGKLAGRLKKAVSLVSLRRQNVPVIPYNQTSVVGPSGSNAGGGNRQAPPSPHSLPLTLLSEIATSHIKHIVLSQQALWEICQED